MYSQARKKYHTQVKPIKPISPTCYTTVIQYKLLPSYWSVNRHGTQLLDARVKDEEPYLRQTWVERIKCGIISSCIMRAYLFQSPRYSQDKVITRWKRKLLLVNTYVENLRKYRYLLRVLVENLFNARKVKVLLPSQSFTKLKERKVRASIKVRMREPVGKGDFLQGSCLEPSLESTGTVYT